MGIVNAPVVAALLVGDPEMEPNIALATTDALAGPPQLRPVSANARSMTQRPAPLEHDKNENNGARDF